MSQENKFDPAEINDEENEATIKDDNQENQHHHHSEHQHSRSHYHSHHGKKHRSSRSKKSSNNNKKSVIDKIQAWIDKKISRKAMALFCLLLLLTTTVLITVIYVVETTYKDLPDDYHSGLPSNEKEQDDSPNSAPSASLSVPSYWKNMIEDKTNAVKALQADGGKNSVSFVWASDTHIPNNDHAKTNDLGKLMAKMMDNCDIPFAMLTGDIGTRASLDTEAELEKSQEKIPKHLAPLWGTDRLLLALGNHDGCYGDSSCYYAKQFSPERMWDLYFRKQAFDERRVFSEDGTYFYIDNVAQKTRFIVLNSQFAGKYSVDDNSIAVNNRFSTSCYGQEQLDWLANVALDMPAGYGAIIASHVPPNVTYTVDKVQLIGIINAYCKKTTYSGSYTAGVDGWTNNSVNVDFSDAKGEIIAMFTGHVHQDTIDTKTLACPLITIISAGAQVNDGEIPERTFGTDSETSFDVVTINRKTRTIYCTRVGWGEDRTVKY